MASAGQNMETKLKGAMVYRSLPESYSELVTAKERHPGSGSDDKICEEEADRRDLRQMNKGRKAKRYYYCRKSGHFRRNCWLLQRKKKKKAIGEVLKKPRRLSRTEAQLVLPSETIEVVIRGVWRH